MNGTMADRQRPGLPAAILIWLLLLAWASLLASDGAWGRFLPETAGRAGPGLNSMLGVLGLLTAFLAQGLLWSTVIRRYREAGGETGPRGRLIRGLNTIRSYIADEDVEPVEARK